MPGLSDYAEKKVLDHILAKTAYPMPSGVYLALFTADPTDAGSLTNEVSTAGTNYARVNVTSIMSATDATTGTSQNATAVSFASATASWGNITWLGLFDASSGGNMLFSGLATNAKQIDVGDIYQMAAQQLTATLS